MDKPSAESLSSYTLGKTPKWAWEVSDDPHASIFHLSFSGLQLWNRARTRVRRNTADFRCAGRKRRSWDKAPITLPRRRTIRVRCRVTGRASTSKGITEGVRSRETIGERLQERDNLVFFLIGQAESTGGHIDIVRHLGPGPAVYFFDRTSRTMSGSNVVHKHVARVVEVD
jgi:hypothetical protein